MTVATRGLGDESSESNAPAAVTVSISAIYNIIKIPDWTGMGHFCKATCSIPINKKTGISIPE
jgi:hypothetical protein